MEILLACLAAFFAGFIDAIAGGGGLIQVPGLLLLFPAMPVVTLLGTNKLAACAGTVMASLHYIRALKIDYKAIVPALIITFIFAALGAKVVSIINNEILKPMVFVLLILIGIYTVTNKNLGLVSDKRFTGWHLQLCCMIMGAALGFYDGFFGPGTGSILMFLLVSLLGFSFLEASAFAKLINLAGNLAALLFFIFNKQVIFKIGLPMAVCNILGNSIGARLAINKGSQFVRWIFLLVIIAMLIQFIRQVS
jgi:uncharacterized membrane protein YfcA